MRLSEQPIELIIETGRLRGVLSADEAVASFKGIPYAAPPVGELRWRAPQPPQPWTGVRDADRYGPRCVQPDRHVRSISYFGPEAESEDCLTLNVWSAAPDGGKWPVMVWFHGGAFYVGSGSQPIFAGDQLARKGVIVVTVNYRLGRLGFLAHPELTKESGFSGNYGLLDQIAALRWVRDNIGAFGGDPGCVTIFGQSAGSISAAALMASPLAKGLFHRAIGMSGGLFGPVRDTCDTGDSIQSLAAAERTGQAFAQVLGAKSLADLRAKPAAEIQFTSRFGQGSGSYNPQNSARGVFDTHWPIVDGHVLPRSPYEIFLAGEQNDVPLMSGNTANEGATMPAAASLQAFYAEAQAEHGANVEEFLALYPASTDDEAADASRTAFSYRNFYWQNWAWARLQAQTGRSPVYVYRFAHVPPLPADRTFNENTNAKLGAFHCAEIPYVFRTLAARDFAWTDVDRRLSDIVSAYWVRFAASGNPNEFGLPEWPAFDLESQEMMEFTDDAAGAFIADVARLEFWDDFYGAAREVDVTASH
jgi:para-nitrobenzyl esterase